MSEKNLDMKRRYFRFIQRCADEGSVALRRLLQALLWPRCDPFLISACRAQRNTEKPSDPWHGATERMASYPGLGH
jgi:hypothetical protein